MALRNAAVVASCLLIGLLSAAQAETMQSFALSASLGSPRQHVAIAQPRKLQIGFDCSAVCADLPKVQACASDGKTYDNACYLACKGKKVAYLGVCAKSKPCLCTPFFSPVCGGGKTYVNPCFAACAGVKSTRPGVCPADCSCPSAPAPVCGQDYKDYTNECKALCAGTNVQYSGTCDVRLGTCKCPNTLDPVCITTFTEQKLSTGTVLKIPVANTYQNPCLAACEGANVKIAKKGACATFPLWNSISWWCNCPVKFLKPVCGINPLGIPTTINSECTAKCLGYKILRPGICGTCICPIIAKPVCANGKTYRTACDARCKGKATTWKAGPCTACSACPKPGSLSSWVCGDDGLSYGNTCLAECVGVTVKSKGFCKF